MRTIYTAVSTLALPLLFAQLWWRGRNLPAYRQRWPERLGHFPPLDAHRPRVWVHAVSVGETIAATGLIKRLIDANLADVLVTTTTPTGSERVRSAFGSAVHHVYAPYDLPWVVRSFLRRAKPNLAVVMETEVWPNMLAVCAEQQVPVILANARLSQRSARGYARFGRTTQRMLECLTVVAAQYPDDGQRFLDLGLAPEKLRVTGSIKFDIHVDEATQKAAASLKQVYSDCGRRPIIIAASTHEGEEAQLLECFGRVLQQHPNALLLLVPRHPDRFEEVAELVKRQYGMVRRSANQIPGSQTQVILGDTMGEMMLLYGASDIAFVGGSLITRGGHNMIEPAAWGLPILSGPHVFNFADIGERLAAEGGLVLVADAKAWAEQVIGWLDHPEERHKAGRIAREFADRNRGALEQLMALIEYQINNSPSCSAPTI